jgi:tetratricopeptide (TPR) repeat protein
VKLTLSAGSDEAKAALWACLEAVENYRSEQARARCGDALTKDSQLALAQILLAQVAPSAATAKKRLAEANETLARRPLPELERLFAEALLAQLEDRRPAALAALDALVASLPTDKRAYHHRGLWRYRTGQLDAALADFEKATQLDGKFGPAWNALGHLQLRRDKLDDAQKAFEKYVEAAPKEANAHDSLASLHLRRGNLGPAVEHARKALELDPKFIKANLRLGDALLFQGNPVAARRAYASVAASADPAEHHEGAMRSARSHLFEAVGAPPTRLFQSAEKELQAEAELAKKLDRKADQLHALVELTRLQLERGALSDAGHTIHSARDLLSESGSKATSATGDSAGAGTEKKADKPDADADKQAEKAAPTLMAEERQRYQAELLVLRALLLGSIGESALAEERADELEKLWRGPLGQSRARELRGDLAARSGDREGVVKLLDPTVTSDNGKATAASLRPLSRLALAFALGGGKPGEQLDTARARTLMEDLSKRNLNDLEGALTRGRARGWLKQNPVEKTDKTEKTDKAESKAEKTP